MVLLQINQVAYYGDMTNKKMVDNITQYTTKIFREREGYTHMFQLIRRRKDGNRYSARVHKTYYFSTVVELMKSYDEIKELCTFLNGRFYGSVNPKSYQNIALRNLVKLSEQIASEQYNVRGLYDSAAATVSDFKDKFWITDIDDRDTLPADFMSGIVEVYTQLQHEAGRDPMCEIIPTKSGYHIISRPFRVDYVPDYYKNRSDIMKDSKGSYTLIFSP